MARDFLDDPLLSRRYFFPRPDRFPEPLRVEVDGATLACALRGPGPGAPTVVHFHGNGEVVGDWLDLLPSFLTPLGWNVLLAEYRGYGTCTGEPLLGTMLDDVDAIVRASGAPPERLVFFGRSVGSIFAVHAASRFPRAAGLVLESGIADVLERLLLRVAPAELGVDADAFERAVRERLDQLVKIAAYPGPVLVLHGRHDGLVDVSHGERLAAAAGGQVTVRIFDHGDHNSILAVNEAAYLAEVAQFLARTGAAARGATPA
jgi:pimeloyl-ACP methyl ester carboxylesterase